MIESVREEGVALAAIKALQAELSAKDHELNEIRRVDETNYARLEQRLDALEARARL